MCAGDSCRYEDPTHYKATNWNTTPVNQMNSGAGFFVVLGICCGYSFEIAIWLLSCRGGKVIYLHKSAESAPLSRRPKCHTWNIPPLLSSKLLCHLQKLCNYWTVFGCNFKSCKGLPYHQLLELSSSTSAFFCTPSVTQTGSGRLVHAEHGARSLLGSSVDMDNIQMSTPGTAQRVGEVVLSPAVLHVTRGRHAGMPRLSHNQICVLP